MTMSIQDQIWNRAAMELGGSNPKTGDSALASLLLFHGMAMNGGIDHAVDVLSQKECQLAINGFRYFGLNEAADIVERALAADESQHNGIDKAYGVIIPSDGTLVSAFERIWRSSPNEFASLDG